MITTDGLQQLSDWIRNGGGSYPAFIGVGLGTTSPYPTDSSLYHEVYPTTTRNVPVITKSNDAVNFRLTQATSEGSTATYAEHGLFTNETTGVCWSRQTYPDIEKDDSVVMESFISIKVISEV